MMSWGAIPSLVVLTIISICISPGILTDDQGGVGDHEGGEGLRRDPLGLVIIVLGNTHSAYTTDIY